MRKAAIAAVILTLTASAAHAQAPGQMPGTLAPAYVPPPPPPPVAPAPVPSAVTPLPSPTYGVPPGVTSPVYGNGGGTVRYQQPARRHKFKRRRNTS